MATNKFVERVPSFVQGMSRQAPSVRFAGQSATADNVYFNVVDGARKRAGTTYLNSIVGGNPTVTYRMHKIERDDEEEYLIVYGTGFFKIYDVVRNQWVSPSFTGETEAYINYGSPTANDFKFVTIADTTFVCNSKVPTRLSEDKNSIVASSMPVLLKRTNLFPSINFVFSEAEWNEQSYEIQYIESASAPHNPSSDGTIVNGAGFKISFEGTDDSRRYKSPGSPEYLQITRRTEATAVQDFLQGNGIKPEDSRNTNKSFTGLDTIPFGKVIVTGGPLHRKKLKVNLSPDLNPTSYLGITENSTGENITVTRGDSKVDAPLQLLDQGQPITDIGYFKNRLVLAGDEFVVFSQADNLFGLYLETPSTPTDSDPIETQIAATDVCMVDFIVPFRSAVMVMTKAGQQFELGGDPLTPATASLTSTTRYETQPVRPTQIGERLFMVGKSSGYSTLLEYFYDDSSTSNVAADISKHVDDLLPGQIRALDASSTQETVLVIPELVGDIVAETIVSDGGGTAGSPAAFDAGSTWVGGVAPNEFNNVTIAVGDVVEFDGYATGGNAVDVSGVNGQIFVYRSYTSGKERKQSAWQRWDFGNDEIQDAKCIDDSVFILRRRQDPDATNVRLFIDKLDLAQGSTPDAGWKTTVHMDHTRDFTSGTLLGGSSTAWTMNPPDASVNCVIDKATNEYKSIITDSTGTLATLVGEDWTSKTVRVGRKVKADIELSQVYPRDAGPGGRATMAVLEGRANLQKLVIEHRNAAAYDVVVKSSEISGDTGRTTSFSPNGDTDTGEMNVWCHGTTDTVTINLTSDSPLPVTWTAMEYHGYHTTRMT